MAARNRDRKADASTRWSRWTFLGGLIEQGEELPPSPSGLRHADRVLPGGVVVVVAVGAVGGARAGAAFDLAAVCQHGDVGAEDEHKQFFHVLFQ